MNAGSGSGGGGGAGPRGNRGLHQQQRQHELDEHGADTVLYYARAGDLEGVRRMVEADATQVRGSIGLGWIGWLVLSLCYGMTVDVDVIGFKSSPHPPPLAPTRPTTSAS